MNCINEAKNNCDEYLTECINVEYGYKNETENNTTKHPKSNKNKKIKLDETVENNNNEDIDLEES